VYKRAVLYFSSGNQFHCQARTSRAQRNHIVLSVLTWIKQAALRKQYNISFYQQQWNTIKDTIALQLKYELIPT